MQQYLHRVTGIFSHMETAKKVVSRLADVGVPLDRIQLMDYNAKVSDAYSAEDEQRFWLNVNVFRVHVAGVIFLL